MSVELKPQRGFGSDNHSGVHPQIMEAILKANQGHAPSYGTDSLTEKATALFRQHFGTKAEVFFVFNGTAANVTALQALTSSFHSILCSDVSHLAVDECGAPEFFCGAKLLPVPSQNGKLRIENLEKFLIRAGDQHHSQVKVLSLTQPTELGTVYSLNELKELTAWAHKNKLFVHIDGARLANAAHTLGCDFKTMTTDLGVDVVSFGGTKNGLMMGEAVVFLNRELAQNFKYIRKQSAQLPSKTRFLAAQFIAYLENDLWKQIASHACAKAQKLASLVGELSGVEIMHPVQSNAVFAKIPKAWIKPLRENYFFYVWDEWTFECRWMTSWDTEDSDLEGFAKKLKEMN